MKQGPRDSASAEEDHKEAEVDRNASPTQNLHDAAKKPSPSPSGNGKNVPVLQESATVQDPQKARVLELEKLCADYKDAMQRLHAELENASKRLEREKEQFRKLANAKVIAEFLPVLDAIEDGLKQAKTIPDQNSSQGLEKVRTQFTQVLARNGVKAIEAAGKKFDHDLHEALMVANEAKAEDGKILEELQKGYIMNGFVLRPAKVKVNKIASGEGEKHGN